jgi:hypothetical protein
MSWGVEPKLARTGGAARAHAMAIAPTAIHRHGPVVIVLTTRRVGLGIEVHDHMPATKIRQLHSATVLVEEGEVGGAIAWFEHERILEGSAGASFRSWRSGVSAPLALASRGRSRRTPVPNTPAFAKAKRKSSERMPGRLLVVPCEREPVASADARIHLRAVVGSTQEYG